MSIMIRIFLITALILLTQCKTVNVPTDVSVPVSQPRLGVSLKVLVGDTILRDFGAQGNRALLVTRVRPDSPAERGGVVVGDLLLSIERKRVYGMRDSVAAMRRKKPGEQVELGIQRNGKPLNVMIQLEE